MKSLKQVLFITVHHIVWNSNKNFLSNSWNNRKKFKIYIYRYVISVYSEYSRIKKYFERKQSFPN